MVTGIGAIGKLFTTNPLGNVESIGGGAASRRTQKVSGGEEAGYSPYAAVSNINCELTPDVTGGGYTNGMGHFASTKNWMF